MLISVLKNFYIEWEFQFFVFMIICPFFFNLILILKVKESSGKLTGFWKIKKFCQIPRFLKTQYVNKFRWWVYYQIKCYYY